MSVGSSVALALLLGCGGVDATCVEGADGELSCADVASEETTPSLEDDVSSGEGIRSLQSDLEVGARGPEVRAAHEYLMSFGYFPNDELAQGYPNWRPMVEQAPARLDVYDEHTAEAVYAFQGMYHLPQTGIVDAATRTAMQTPRCGFPDGAATPDHPELTEKFSYASGVFHGTQWSAGSLLRWYLVNGPLAAFHQVAASAFPKWLQHTYNMTVQETAEPSFAESEIRIGFVGIDGPGGGVLARAWPPGFTNSLPHCVEWLSGDNCVGNIEFDVAETWSTQSPTPAGAVDLETVLMHEFGHVLGLYHSSATLSIMVPYFGERRNLAADDIVATAAMYDVFEQVNTTVRARDIGVANDGTANGKAWIITNTPLSGSFRIAEMTGETSFALDSEAAVRIAVAPGGRPWVVDAFGTVYRKGSLHATASSDWIRTREILNPDGTVSNLCATDIAIGATTAEGQVWAIGCDTVPGGHSIYRYNNSLSPKRWQKETAGGGAVRIAVDSGGVPWVANEFGRIFWHSNTATPPRPSNSISGAWQMTSATGLANDIGISANGLPWIIGKDEAVGGFGIWLYNGQSAGTGLQPAPAKDEWLRVTNGATAISVGPNGRPWVVANDGTIWHLKQ